MRNFIIVGHRAMTTPKFTLNDLPGSGGRMDLVARTVSAAFILSHDIRRDVEVSTILLGPEEPPKTIRFFGKELKYLNPDERSTSALIRNALIKYSARGSKNNPVNRNSKNAQEPFLDEITASPGIYISKHGLAEVLDQYSENSSIVYLHENGKDIFKSDLSGELTFILSDNQNFTPEEEKMIKDKSTHELSLGPKVLHAEHCISLIHNFLDRADLK